MIERTGQTDEQIIRCYAAKIYNRLYSEAQKGCPDLTADGEGWRYSFAPKGVFNMELEEVKALLRLFTEYVLKGIESFGGCKDCIHGCNVSSNSGFWPVIPDCSGCLDPLHQHFIHMEYLPKYNAITKEDVFLIPNGGTIPLYIERLVQGIEDRHYDYYEARGFVHAVKDEKRICLMGSLGLLSLEGNKRFRR